MSTYDDGYWRGYKDGATDKKNKLISLVQGFDWNHEWESFELKRALLRVLEAEK